MNIEKNTLFYGDNLDILRDYIEDESIDLIYLDPPFKKQKKYNIIFPEPNGSPSEAQTMVYADTWFWNDISEKYYEELVNEAPESLANTIIGLRKFLHESDMMTYLVHMAIRLIELNRVLKPAGSIYLHCDYTASHYLKLLMDSIFGDNNFRNEIIWCFRGGGVPKKDFSRKHNTVFRYSKTDDYIFNVDEVRVPYSEESRKRLKYKARAFRGEKIYDTYEPHKKGKHPEDWWVMQPIMPSSKERLSYPTQKPERLLEKIIKASSKEGDLILDPFCGCGTTIAIAEKLKRKWIGIDITYLAINLMKYRLYDSFGELDYDVIGDPKDLHGAINLAKQDKYQFQYWALSLVNARPLGHTTKGRKGADRGIDGIKYIAQFKGEATFIIVQVKSGHVTSSQIRDLKGTIDRENAQIGVFITLEKPTKEMTKEAASTGFYRLDLDDLQKEYPGIQIDAWKKEYPKVQILTIEEILKEGKNIKYPPAVGITFKKAPKVEEESKQLKIQ